MNNFPVIKFSIFFYILIVTKKLVFNNKSEGKDLKQPNIKLILSSLRFFKPQGFLRSSKKQFFVHDQFTTSYKKK
jgi:hypothetical protein